jgi:DNA polymerase III subunit delta
MVALKGRDIEAFVARPNPAQPIVLLYGPDAGLVHERAEKIVARSLKDPNDPFALIRFDGDLLASETSRLAEEAHTVPMFGGDRAIWIKSGSRPFVSAVEAVINDPPAGCRIVIEAGNLRRTAPLLVLCEKARVAAAINCYADKEDDLIRLVDEEMRAAKLTIAPDARAALVGLIGGDRQASRNEIRKLALYAHGKDRVVLDDVLIVVADASALGSDAVVDAAFAGKTPDLETQLAKTQAAGTSPGTIMSAALRYVTQLHKARTAFDGGDAESEALRAFIPPIHFTRRNVVEAALRSWTLPRLTQAMEQLAKAALQVRRTPKLAQALTHRALLTVSYAARRQSR